MASPGSLIAQNGTPFLRYDGIAVLAVLAVLAVVADKTFLIQAPARAIASKRWR